MSMQSKELGVPLTTGVYTATAQLAWVPPQPTCKEYDSPRGSHHHHFDVDPPCQGAKPECAPACTQTPSTELPERHVTSPLTSTLTVFLAGTLTGFLVGLLAGLADGLGLGWAVTVGGTCSTTTRVTTLACFGRVRCFAGRSCGCLGRGWAVGFGDAARLGAVAVRVGVMMTSALS